MEPTISVCIATYHRPALLKKLLLSLINQETNGEFSFTINVGDNDEHRSAESVVRELNSSGQNIRYAVEPVQNISLARNKSISLATGNYIATIDDDLYADSRWLLNLHRAAITHNADVVNGPVIAEFQANTPKYIKECELFTRPNPPTASNSYFISATGNSLFRRSLVENESAPFDPEFGKTGGEDTFFFMELKKRGCRIIWCREALVFGPVSPAKANLRWILKRRFRTGNTRPRYFKDSDRSKIKEILKCSKAIVISSAVALFYLMAIFFNKNYSSKSLKRLLSVVYNAGILAHYASFRYEEYSGNLLVSDRIELNH